MLNVKEIYQMQNDIEDLKANGGGGGNAKSGMTPVEYNIASDDWTLNSTTGLYEYSLSHNDNLKLKELTLKFYVEQVSMDLVYEFIDENTVKIFSDVAEPVLVVLHERYIEPEALSVDLSNYYTKDETYNKAEIDAKDKTINNAITENSSKIDIKLENIKHEIAKNDKTWRDLGVLDTEVTSRFLSKCPQSYVDEDLLTLHAITKSFVYDDLIIFPSIGAESIKSIQYDTVNDTWSKTTYNFPYQADSGGYCSFVYIGNNQALISYVRNDNVHKFDLIENKIISSHKIINGPCAFNEERGSIFFASNSSYVIEADVATMKEINRYRYDSRSNSKKVITVDNAHIYVHETTSYESRFTKININSKEATHHDSSPNIIDAPQCIFNGNIVFHGFNSGFNKSNKLRFLNLDTMLITSEDLPSSLATSACFNVSGKLFVIESGIHVISDPSRNNGNVVSVSSAKPPTTVEQARATTVELAKYAGTQGQLVVNTDDNSLVVMDGSTKGGHKLAKALDIESLKGHTHPNLVTNFLKYSNKNKHSYKVKEVPLGAPIYGRAVNHFINPNGEHIARFLKMLSTFSYSMHDYNFATEQTTLVNSNYSVVISQEKNMSFGMDNEGNFCWIDNNRQIFYKDENIGLISSAAHHNPVGLVAFDDCILFMDNNQVKTIDKISPHTQETIGTTTGHNPNPDTILIPYGNDKAAILNGSDIYIVNPTTKTVTKKVTLDKVIKETGCCTIGDKLFIYFGTIDNIPSPYVYEVDLLTGEYTKTESDIDSAYIASGKLKFISPVAYGNEVYLFSGKTTDINTVSSNDIAPINRAMPVLVEDLSKIIPENKGFTGYDTVSNKPKYWNGTEWCSYEAQAIAKEDSINFKKLTQAEYDAITTKDDNTMYIIIG